MLFNSPEFLFVFLPITLFLFFLIAHKFSSESAIGFLVIASLFFYAWWKPVYLVLLMLSMVVNFSMGTALAKKKAGKKLLIFGVILNLGLLAYYKYAGFIVQNLNLLDSVNWQIEQIFLPLAISFFTFQQIAYLIDSYKGITQEYRFSHYALFVSFFPQLIAGPIVHHKEMLPQFGLASTFKFNLESFAIGISIFALGLFKKTVIADGVAIYANPVFAAAEAGQSIDFFTAWGGALCYSLQLYFDFSGYSDMAIGLARMFGIILPLNFYSPYKSASIAEFWRRWHMTLSRFLRDYIYIPLGGNRQGVARRYQNLFITMLLGGFWHGAGWNFVIWGALHGSYLTVHQLWLKLTLATGFELQRIRIYQYFAWMITMLAVVVGWVFFRATSFNGATKILSAMVGANGISLPNAIYSQLGALQGVLETVGISANNQSGSQFVTTWLYVIILIPVCLCMPTIQDCFNRVKGSLNQNAFDIQSAIWPGLKMANRLVWQTNGFWALICALAFGFGIMTFGQVSEFLYFQF